MKRDSIFFNLDLEPLNTLKAVEVVSTICFKTDRFSTDHNIFIYI